MQLQLHGLYLSPRLLLQVSKLTNISRSHNTSPLEKHHALLDWVRRNGGSLHEGVEIAQDASRGVHLQVKRDWAQRRLVQDTSIIQTPLSLTLSYFNAVDHRLSSESRQDEPVATATTTTTTTFSSRGVVFPRTFIDAVGPEETTAFFLMGQYLLGSTGYWYPYISTLPQPGKLTTPLYFDGEDLEWLEGTSLWPAREQRLQIWKEKYESSLKVLRDVGVDDADSYSWKLYLWASTIITSRAFSSKVLSGVIADSELPEDRMSVLLPLIDLPNHRPLAKVEWRAGPQDVSLRVLEDVVAGQEISNNYGPRNNEQLMMNYGFCLPDNSCDYRIVSLRAPPGTPLEQIKAQQRQAFPAVAADSEDHYYVFNIFYPLLTPESSMEHTIFSPALFDAVSIIAANDRELETVEVSADAIKVPLVYGNSRNTLAALSQIVIELITHIVKLKSTGSKLQEPANLKQAYAKTYRDSQIALSQTALILASWTLRRACRHGVSDTWEETKSLLTLHMSCVPSGHFPERVLSRLRVKILERPSLLKNSGELFKFTEVLEVLPSSMRDPCRVLFHRILTQAEREVPMLQGSSEEPPIGFPMFLSFVAEASRSNAAGLSDRLRKWIEFLFARYPLPPEDVAWMLEEEDDEYLLESFNSFLEAAETQDPDLFSAIADSTGGSKWLSPNRLRWAWMVVEQETVQVPEDPLRFVSDDGTGQNRVMLSTVSHLYIPECPEQIAELQT